MKKKLVKYGKILLALTLIGALTQPSYATVGAADGSAFVTKAEFDAALSDFNARLTTFEAGINSKIDSQVSSYLDRNGIWNGKVANTKYLEYAWGRHSQSNKLNALNSLQYYIDNGTINYHGGKSARDMEAWPSFGLVSQNGFQESNPVTFDVFDSVIKSGLWSFDLRFDSIDELFCKYLAAMGYAVNSTNMNRPHTWYWCMDIPEVQDNLMCYNAYLGMKLYKAVSSGGTDIIEDNVLRNADMEPWKTVSGSVVGGNIQGFFGMSLVPSFNHHNLFVSKGDKITMKIALYVNNIWGAMSSVEQNAEDPGCYLRFENSYIY